MEGGMGFFGSLFGINKLNADPKQQELAQALISAVEQHRGFATREIFYILCSNGWSRSEQGNRLAHAASMVKVMRADIYPQAKKLTRDLYVSL
jgi:hypothetical protein